MPDTARIGVHGHSFGQGGYAAYGRIQLPGLGSGQEEQGAPSLDPAVAFRKSMLFYFGNCRLEGSVLSMITTGIKESIDKGKEVKKAFEEPPDPEAGALSTTVANALRSAEEGVPPWLAEAGRRAAENIQGHLPPVISGIMSEVGKLPGAEVKSFGSNLVTGIKKVKSAWNSRGVEDALRKGAPTEIVARLQEQLKTDGVKSLGRALKDAAVIVAGLATSGGSLVVTTILDKIAALLGYIWKLFKKIRDFFALKNFFVECKQKFVDNDPLLFDLEGFRAWVSRWMGALPIIASHCICSGVTGSYIGFMTAISDKDKLSSCYEKFVKLKKPAKKYVKDYYHQFKSDDAVVAMSLQITQYGGYDMTDGAAAKSVGWFRKRLMKIGLMKNTLYTTS